MYYITVEPVFYHRPKSSGEFPYIKSLYANKLDKSLNKAGSLLIYSRRHSISTERYTVQQDGSSQRKMSFYAAAKLFSIWCSNAALLVFRNSDTLLLFQESFARVHFFFSPSNMADLGKSCGSVIPDNIPLMAELRRLGAERLIDFLHSSSLTTDENYPTYPTCTNSILEKIFLKYGFTPRISGKTAFIETPLSCWSFNMSGGKTLLRRCSISGTPLGFERQFNSLYSALRYVKRHDISCNIATK